MKFTVSIDLGNEGMSTDDDVAGALYDIAARIREKQYIKWKHGKREVLTKGIMNRNGNKIGEWTIETTPREFPTTIGPVYWTRSK